ncbi:MAG: methyl-accepting chemotaxis protein [Treponema sp.]|nr:methyl-accepting chemotaxis protein [Treponema sp.]
MKIKIKLTLLGVALTVVVAVAISIALTNRASSNSMEMSVNSLEFLNDQQTEYWFGRVNGHLRVLHTLANILGNYDSFEPDLRRDTFDEIIMAVMADEVVFFEIGTIWRANAFDNDADHIGRQGSTETGQYASVVSRDEYTHELFFRTSGIVDMLIDYINGPNARQDRIETPEIIQIRGEDNAVMRMSVPIISKSNGRVMGMVNGRVDLVAVQPAVMQTMRTHPDIAAMSIYANNGYIVASYLPDNIGNLLHEVPTMFADNLGLVQQTVREGGNLVLDGYSASMDSNTKIDLSSFTIGTSDMTWTIMLAMAESTIMAPVQDMVEFAVIIALVVIVVGSIVAFFIYSATTKPIITVTETLKDISEGDGDLTHSIVVNSKDEIGNMAKYFNLTIEKIKIMVRHVMNETKVITDMSSALASDMTETAAAMNEITANIQSIKSRMINQSASVTETNATMEQITTNINNLNGHVEQQSTSVSQSSSAIEEMLANIQSVTTTLVRNGENVEKLTEASDVGRTGLQDVASDIQEISRESEGLLEINAVMENIASQTNLLSMNAAIEAAHAGDAGRGFAVVAEEIRKLAESSSEQSKTISTVLKKIKTSIDKITQSTDSVLKRFEAIDTSVRTVAEQEENIRNAMEEQGQGSKQILEAIGHLNDTSQLVKNGSLEMLEGAREVMRETENLDKSTQEITGGMNEMASGVDQVNKAVTNINELTAKNRETADLLMKEVQKFKIV